MIIASKTCGSDCGQIRKAMSESSECGRIDEWVVWKKAGNVAVQVGQKERKKIRRLVRGSGREQGMKEGACLLVVKVKEVLRGRKNNAWFI
jgi:hypothetical protein